MKKAPRPVTEYFYHATYNFNYSITHHANQGAVNRISKRAGFKDPIVWKEYVALTRLREEPQIYCLFFRTMGPKALAAMAAHEAYHVVRARFQAIGLPLDESTDEAVTYFLQQLVWEILSVYAEGVVKNFDCGA